MSSSSHRADPRRSCDCDAFVARLDGDVKLAREMALTFVAEAPGLFAHALKGAAANFDAADTVAAAAEIERAAAHGDLAAAPLLVTRLHAAAPPLIAALRAFGGSGSCES